MHRCHRITRSPAARVGELRRPNRSHLLQRRGARVAARALLTTVLLCLAAAPAWARSNDEQQERDRQQMKGLDEQVQEIKSDVLAISEELSRLEENLLYPSGTQVAIFVDLAAGETMRLDAVQIEIDGRLVAHYIYSAKELEALRKGGVQRVYVGNISTGEHQLEVTVDGKLENGKDFSHTGQFTFRKEVRPELVGLTLSGPGTTGEPIVLQEW